MAEVAHWLDRNISYAAFTARVFIVGFVTTLILSEVSRLFRLRRIRPAWKTRPQMMDKVDGRWVARLGYS